MTRNQRECAEKFDYYYQIGSFIIVHEGQAVELEEVQSSMKDLFKQKLKSVIDRIVYLNQNQNKKSSNYRAFQQSTSD